jgi:hypothetical protein
VANQSGPTMRGVMVWQRRWWGYGMDKGEDSHRKVWRGPYEKEEGTTWLHDIAEEQRKVQRRCSPDGGDGGGAATVGSGFGGIGVSHLVR